MKKTDKPAQASLMIKHATILSMDARHTKYEDGSIVITGSEITAIGKTADLEKQFIAERVIDATNCIIIPGLINAHTHIPMTYFRGLADDLTLHEWLNKYIWPLEKKFVIDKSSPTPDFVYDATLHGTAELIKNGITLANDMYFKGQQMAKAITKSGMRCIIGDPILNEIARNKNQLSEVGKAAIELTQEYRNNPLLDFSIAPHAIYSVTRKQLERCTEIALKHGLMVHMHLSEAKHEVPDCLKEHGKKPVAFLEEIGLLNTKITLAHGIHVDTAEMKILAKHDASIVICTESNLKLASGFAPISKYLKHGVRCCFGTDGVASNNNQDLLTELDFTAKVHKNLKQDPTFLPAEKLLAMATIEAAKAVHKDTELGSLEIGKKADLTILNCNTVEAQPLYNPYSQVIYALGGRAVRDVIINGQIVLKDKKLTTLDESELISQSNYYRDLIKIELSDEKHKK